MDWYYFSFWKKVWDKFERNNKDVSLNTTLSAHETKKKINIIRISKFNRKRKYQVILLMITNDEWLMALMMNGTMFLQKVYQD